VRYYNREIVSLLLDRVTEVIVIVVYFPAHSGLFSGAVAVRGFLPTLGFSR